MRDLIERLNDPERYTDAVDEAVDEIKRLRAEHVTMTKELEEWRAGVAQTAKHIESTFPFRPPELWPDFVKEIVGMLKAVQVHAGKLREGREK